MTDNSLVLRPNYPVSRRPQRETLTFWNAQIIFRNFAGKAKQFNDEGDRNFSIVLDEELAQQLQEKGWNIKPLRKMDPDEPQMYQLPVTVSYKVRVPRVYMVTGDGERIPLRKAMLTEELVWMMDTLDLAEAHLVVAASNWTMGGKSGKKAYLQSFFGHVELDEVEERYATVEDMVDLDTQKYAPLDDNVIEGDVV